MAKKTSVPVGDARVTDGGMLARFSAAIQRAGFSNLLGQVFGGKRDYWEVFGYDRQLDSNRFWEMYHRGGIAHRIIHAYPDTLWARSPQLYTPNQPEWNAAWDTFAKKTKIWDAIKKADILAGLGRYSIILVGTTSPNMESPLRKGRSIKYLQPYSERNAAISEWERDPTSEHFGMPKYYTIYPNKNRNNPELSRTGTAPVASSFRVHASRVWHIQRGALESSVYGIPRYAPIWNYLYDLIKIVGSSAESYWMTAYQGIHANINPEMEMEEGDAQDLSDEVDEYVHGLRRFIRTRGVEVKSLGSKVADPKGAFDVVLTLISGTTGIPKRILLGSEAGQLASAQDRANWAERIEEERANHAEPDIIMPIIEWIEKYEPLGIPTSADAVQLLWPEAFRMSPLERSQTSAQIARTITNISKGMAPIVTKPGKAAVVDPTTGATITEATEDVTDEALITRDEAREIIGLSTDQQVLIEKPD